MKQQIVYVELKQDHSGPAWIGYAQFSKSGQTVYFNGKILGKRQSIHGNHFDIETDQEYWISGVKKNGQDRHWAGGGKIHIDESVIQDYLKIINASELPKNKFITTVLNNIPNKELSREIENEIQTEKPFNTELLFKDKNILSDDELTEVIDYYNSIDIPTHFHLKYRKNAIRNLKENIAEQERRSKTRLT